MPGKHIIKQSVTRQLAIDGVSCFYEAPIMQTVDAYGYPAVLDPSCITYKDNINTMHA